jgi:hypothetical protein
VLGFAASSLVSLQQEGGKKTHVALEEDDQHLMNMEHKPIHEAKCGSWIRLGIKRSKERVEEDKFKRRRKRKLSQVRTRYSPLIQESDQRF